MSVMRCVGGRGQTRKFLWNLELTLLPPTPSCLHEVVLTVFLPKVFAN